MPLTLTLREPITLSLDFGSLSAAVVRANSAAEVARVEVFHGNRRLPVGEFFDVTGDGREDGRVVVEGDCGRVDRLGYGWDSGGLRVVGNVGRHCGAGMRGGELIVEGSAGDGAGAEMRGGYLLIAGDAGDFLGGGLPGSRRGMRGGEIFVAGSAGNEVGSRLRRGLIAVQDNVGSFAGLGMIAGTLVVGGVAGPGAGSGLKRGSIVCLSPQGGAPLPNFRESCVYAPVFLKFLMRSLTRRGFVAPDWTPESLFRRYNGDVLELGKGELLCPA